jgi:undecaprenyl pyrophosphate phosphatase UppP
VEVGVVALGGPLVFTWMDLVANGGPTAANPSVVPVGVVVTFVFGFVGVDWFLDGRHTDLSVFEPGSIIGGRTDAGEK